jgi:hypothetical protein
MDDISGKPSQSKREPATEVKQGAEKNEQTTQEQENAAQFAKRIHFWILTKDCGQRLPPRFVTSVI